MAYDTPCMHEVVLTDRNQREHGVSTMDIAKRLIDKGFHPPTVYFPLVVPHAIMVEPTETEALQELDSFVAAMHEIAAEAADAPELLQGAPHNPVRGRLDEVAAAKKPRLRYDFDD